MATDGTITIIENSDELVRMYVHCDSFITDLGYEISNWLLPRRIGNGYSYFTRNDEYFVNGGGDLAAQFIRDFKNSRGKNLYIINPTIVSDINHRLSSQYIDTSQFSFSKGIYNYKIEISYIDFKTIPCDEVVTITVTDSHDEIIIKGSPSEVLRYIYKEKSKDPSKDSVELYIRIPRDIYDSIKQTNDDEYDSTSTNILYQAIKQTSPIGRM